MHTIPCLPLGLLAVKESLEDGDNLVQSSQVLAHLLLDLLLVGAKLAVEVLAVRAGAHGGAENGLDEEAVVRLEGDAVGAAEGLGELVVVVGQVLAQRDACELEAPGLSQTSVAVHPFARCRGSSPDEPEQALGRGMGLGLELVPHEILEVLGLKRRGQEPFPEFLCADDISRQSREQSEV